MLRQACSKAAPVTGQLRILPKVADNSPGQSEYRSVVKEGQKNGGKIGDGGLVGLDGPPVRCSLHSLRRLTASINVTKACEILGGNCRSGPEQNENARHQMVHIAPRLHRDWFGDVIEPSTIVTNRCQLSHRFRAFAAV